MEVTVRSLSFIVSFFFNDPATTEIYTLSLHDALPISSPSSSGAGRRRWSGTGWTGGTRAGSACRAVSPMRSEEHTSELQSHSDLVCRLLLEKKKFEGEGEDGRSAPVSGRDGAAVPHQR